MLGDDSNLTTFASNRASVAFLFESLSFASEKSVSKSKFGIMLINFRGNVRLNNREY